MVKLYILSLSSGVSRVFWYWWEGQPWGTLFCKSPNPATGCSESARSHPYLLNAGLAYGEVERWLEYSVLKGCSQSAEGTFLCELTDESGHRAEVVWNSINPRPISARGQFVTATDIYGGSQPLTPSFTIGYSPVLLRSK